jgi:hypothetical protein
MTTLHWKKGFFSSTYNILSNDQLIGTLDDSTFSSKASGGLNGLNYTFKTTGVLKQKTQIFNAEGSLIGEIAYNSWMTKATISISNNSFFWKYNNIWNTSWSIFNSDGLEIKYCGSSTRGKIESTTDDGLILLSGLFVTNYYWQMTLAIIIVSFVPIMNLIF